MWRTLGEDIVLSGEFWKGVRRDFKFIHRWYSSFFNFTLAFALFTKIIESVRSFSSRFWSKYSKLFDHIGYGSHSHVVSTWMQHQK